MTELYVEPSVAVDQYPWLTGGQEEELAYLKEHGRFPLSKSSGGLVQGVLIASGGATCFFVSGISTRVSAQYIWIYDGIAAPASNAAPNGPVIYVPAGPINFSAAWGLTGRRFFAGVYVANSTSATAYTAGSADTVFDVQYV